MNKKELLKTLKKEHNERRDKALIAAEKMYEWLKERKCIDTTYEYKDLTYLINNHKAIATYIDYRTGVVELMPFSAQVDIGSGFVGGTLRVDFN